jgi:hypothetical protein
VLHNRFKTQDGLISHHCPGLSGNKCCLQRHNSVFPVSWRRSITAHSCRVTVTARFARSFHLTINCFPIPRRPVFEEPVLLLEITGLLYQLRNCSVPFGTTSRNCWDIVWRTHEARAIHRPAASDWLQLFGEGQEGGGELRFLALLELATIASRKTRVTFCTHCILVI